MDKKSFEMVLDEIRKVITFYSLNHFISYEFSWFILVELLGRLCNIRVLGLQNWLEFKSIYSVGPYVLIHFTALYFWIYCDLLFLNRFPPLSVT